MVEKSCLILEATRCNFTFSYAMPVGCTFDSALDALTEITQALSLAKEQSIEKAKEQKPVQPEIIDEPVTVKE